MLAYHSDPSLKTRVLAELATHEAADRLRQHYGYWRQLDGQFRGCAVGCSLESIRAAMGLAQVEHNCHALYETYLGVPQVLAIHEDHLFERLSPEAARQLPRRFLEAIQAGADLSMVFHRWMRAVLAEPGGVQAGVARRPAIKPAVDGVIALYDRWLAGDRPLAEDWRAARHAAYAAAYAAAASAASAAAYAAADAAAYAADAAAAADAAYAAAASAASAAYAADASAAYAADAYAADAAAYAAAEVQRQADLLIRCLSEAPIPAAA
jgi:hypothetical protein